GSIVRSTPWRATVLPLAKVLVTPASSTTLTREPLRANARGRLRRRRYGLSPYVLGNAPASGASRRDLGRAVDDEPLGEQDREEERDPEHRGDHVRRPELLRLDRVVLVEVDDRAAEPALDRGRGLRDDRADDRERRCDPKGGEEERHRVRDADLPEDRPPAG